MVGVEREWSYNWFVLDFSVSDLDSDEDDEEDLDEGMNEKPLTAKEAKQLQREWLKSRYDTIRNGSDDEASHYENVKDQRYIFVWYYFYLFLLLFACLYYSIKYELIRGTYNHVYVLSTSLPRVFMDEVACSMKHLNKDSP